MLYLNVGKSSNSMKYLPNWYVILHIYGNNHTTNAFFHFVTERSKGNFMDEIIIIGICGIAEGCFYIFFEYVTQCNRACLCEGIQLSLKYTKYLCVFLLWKQFLCQIDRPFKILGKNIDKCNFNLRIGNFAHRHPI